MNFTIAGSWIASASILAIAILCAKVQGNCKQRLSDGSKKVLIYEINETMTTQCAEDYMDFKDSFMCLSNGSIFSGTVCKNSCSTKVEQGAAFQEIDGHLVPYNSNDRILDHEKMLVVCNDGYVVGTEQYTNTSKWVTCRVHFLENGYIVMHDKVLCKKLCDISDLTQSEHYEVHIPYGTPDIYLDWETTYIQCKNDFAFKTEGNPTAMLVRCDEDGHVYSFDPATVCQKYQRQLLVFTEAEAGVIMQLNLDDQSIVQEVVRSSYDNDLTSTFKLHCGTYQDLVLILLLKPDELSNNVRFYNNAKSIFEPGSNDGQTKKVLMFQDNAMYDFPTLFGHSYKNQYIICCMKTSDSTLHLIFLNLTKYDTGVDLSHTEEPIPNFNDFEPFCGTINRNHLILIGSEGKVRSYNFENKETVDLPMLSNVEPEHCLVTALDDYVYVCGRDVTDTSNLLCQVLINVLVVNASLNEVSNSQYWKETDQLSNRNASAIVASAFDIGKRSVGLFSSSNDGKIYYNEIGLGNKKERVLNQVPKDSQCVADTTFKPYLGPAIIIFNGQVSENATSAAAIAGKSRLVFYPDNPHHSNLVPSEMNLPRYGSSCYADNYRFILCCGGIAEATGEVLRHCEQLDFQNEKWIFEDQVSVDVQIKFYYSIYMDIPKNGHVQCGGLDSHSSALSGCQTHEGRFPSPFFRKLPCASHITKPSIQILLFGGTNEDGQKTTQIDVFNLTDKTWKKFPSSLNHAYHYCSAISFEVNEDASTEEIVLVCGFTDMYTVECERFFSGHPSMGFSTGGSYTTKNKVPWNPGNVQLETENIHTQVSESYPVVYAKFGSEIARYDIFANEWSSAGELPEKFHINDRKDWSFKIFEMVQNKTKVNW